MQDVTQQSADLALRDIHLPEPVSWWPPAPGWWILAGLLIAVFIVFVVLRKFKQRKQLQKAALAELENIRERYQNNRDTMQLVQSLSVLLRRSCMSFYPRANTAGLTGKQWLDYLDSTSTAKGFSSETGEILATAPYLPENSTPDIDSEAVITLCENWLRAQPFKQTHGDTSS